MKEVATSISRIVKLVTIVFAVLLGLKSNAQSLTLFEFNSGSYFTSSVSGAPDLILTNPAQNAASGTGSGGNPGGYLTGMKRATSPSNSDNTYILEIPVNASTFTSLQLSWDMRFSSSATTRQATVAIFGKIASGAYSLIESAQDYWKPSSSGFISVGPKSVPSAYNNAASVTIKLEVTVLGTSSQTIGFDNIKISGTQVLGTPPTATTTSPVSPVGTNTATISGNITALGSAAVTTRGFAIGTSTNPVVDANAISESSTGYSTGAYSLNASGLNAGTTYHTRAFATNSAGTSYGADVSFTTLSGPPSVTTGTVGTVTSSSAPINSNIVTATGGATVTSRGIVYNTTGSAPVQGVNPPATYGTAISNGSGTGAYNVSLSSLSPGTTYHAWAYATNTNGTAYGGEVSFTTKANYRSKSDGDWDQISTWQVYNGSSWVDAVSAPTSADGTIEIVNGHTVTVGATVTADQVTVNGTLRVNVSGTSFPGIVVNGTYQHDINDKAIPDAAWNSGSELLISGLTSSGDLSNMDQNFANITIDCPNYNVALATATTVIASNSGFSMKPGSKMWFKNIGNGGNMTITSTGTITIPFLQIDDDIVSLNRNAGSSRTVNTSSVEVNGNATFYIVWGNSTSNDGTLNLNGDLTMSPTSTMAYVKGSGSPEAFVNFTGTSKNLQFGQVSGTINFTVSGGPADLLSDWSIPSGSLTISSNKINTSSNILSIGSAVSFSRTTGYINGKFGKGIGSGTTSKTFEIGDATNYTPVTIGFSGATNSSGMLVASTTATDHPDLSNSGINASKSVNRYFSVENNGVSGFSSFNITLNYAAADVDAGATAANFKVRKYSTASIPSWITPASVSVGSNSITANGFSSFSDFAIGEVAIPTTTSIMNVTATYGDGVVTLTAGIIPPDATGLIHFFVDCLEVGTGMNAGGTATFDLDPSALTVGNHVIRAEYYTDGTYESSVSENGELTIHPKQLTVTIAANDKEYDGTTNAVVSVATVSGVIGSDDVSVAASNGQFIDKNVGNGKEVSASLALNGDDKDNYTIDLTAITTASISAKAVTISIAADNKPYDSNTSATVTAVDPVAGVVAGDDVIASASNGQFASADAGNGIAVSADVAAAGDDAGNYTFNNTASTTADITKADATIVVNGYTGMYDGNEHGASLVSAIGVNNEDLTASVDLGLKYKNVGVENAGWTFSNKNYNAQADAVEIEITPAELIVTVNNASKLCGQADPVFTGMITGAVGLEVFTATYTAVGTAIAASINENTDNYDVIIYEGLLSITGVPIDASASSNPVKLGDIAKLSATVSPVAANVKVSFYLNDVLQCAVMTNASGIATKDITGLAVGVYKVKAIVGDDCAESIAYLPVYDPSGGFVTGGGWILSPAGAYVADAALTGKANFGFNAKYKKGSNAVDGNTEFQFQAGNLNFKSTENTAGTLVIAGAKANFKGKGSINGVAGYSFMVSGIDGDINGGGGTDKFRIKIWNTASSELVYDNNLGVDENSVPTTCLGGGSIVIHEVKAGGKTSQKVDPDLLVTSLDARVFNNPAAGASTFRLKVLSPDADQKISLRIVDMSGKSLDQMQGLSAGQTVEFGAMYKTGMYVAEILQNGQRKLVKLVKQ